MNIFFIVFLPIFQVPHPVQAAYLHFCILLPIFTVSISQDVERKPNGKYDPVHQAKTVSDQTDDLPY